MDIVTLWVILKARRALFISIIAPSISLVLVTSLLWPPNYIATTSLVIDTKSIDPITGNSTSNGEVASSILATQLDIIGSHNVALKVVDRLGLTKDAGYRKKLYTTPTTDSAFRDVVASELSREVSPAISSKDSNVLNISFPSKSPSAAASIANAYADSFIQTSLELREDPARRQSAWFERQTRTLRQRVDSAQDRLLTAQRASKIVGTESHVDVDTAKLTEISAQLVQAQQVLYDSRNRLRQMNESLAKEKLDALPDVINNSHLQTLKTELARAESSFAEVAARYDRKHPQYLSAEANLNALKQKFIAEVESVKGSIEQTAQISQRQVDELKRAVDEQTKVLLEEKHSRDDLEILNHELQSAQAAYDVGMQRANEMRLSSELNQSSIAILNIAVAPIKAAQPRPILYTVFAAVFASLLAAGVCLTLEILGRRVRSSRDVIELCGIHVLSEIPILSGSRQ